MAVSRRLAAADALPGGVTAAASSSAATEAGGEERSARAARLALLVDASASVDARLGAAHALHAAVRTQPSAAAAAACASEVLGAEGALDALRALITDGGDGAHAPAELLAAALLALDAGGAGGARRAALEAVCAHDLTPVLVATARAGHAPLRHAALPLLAALARHAPCAPALARARCARALMLPLPRAEPARAAAAAAGAADALDWHWALDALDALARTPAGARHLRGARAAEWLARAGACAEAGALPLERADGTRLRALARHAALLAEPPPR